MSIVLHQFPYSHYNDKARWALAWKGVEHTKKNYLPGLHAKPIKELTGQTQTPVLEIDGKFVSGSDAIIAELEERYPDKPLLPESPDLRQEVLALEQTFDKEIGIPVRAVVFSILIDEGTYIAKMFGTPQPLAKRLAYRLMFPMAKGKVRAAYRTSDVEYIDRCKAAVDASLDLVASRTRATGHLVGDGFTLADLSAAALFGPAIGPDHPDMRQPEPVPRALVDFAQGWRAHETADWVRRMYRDFR